MTPVVAHALSTSVGGVAVAGTAALAQAATPDNPFADFAPFASAGGATAAVLGLVYVVKSIYRGDLISKNTEQTEAKLTMLVEQLQRLVEDAHEREQAADRREVAAEKREADLLAEVLNLRRLVRDNGND